MLTVSDVLVKYDLFQYFESWFNDSTFPTYTDWKKIVRYEIQVFERGGWGGGGHAWAQFCNSHPDTYVAQSCFENMSISQFWSIADEYPDLVAHTQARLMGNFGLNACVPWLKDTDCAICFICKEDIESTDHFLLDCPQFKENFDSIWCNLDLKIMTSTPKDGIQIANFIKELNRQNKIMLLVGGLSLPFDHGTTT